jgi:3-oxoacyl-[acyl-carrier protein] reductase
LLEAEAKEMDLREKNVIVTGGANGIGRCLVNRLISEKATVGVLDTDKDALDGLKKETPDVYCRTCDVCDPGQVEESIDDFFSRFGSIDVLVNNAGVIYNALLVNMRPDASISADIEAWDRTIRTNLSSVFYVTTYAVRKMFLRRTKGVIVNVTSISASGNMGQSAYSAAQAGVSALIVTWAKELSPLGIRVVGIAPGFTKTDAVTKSMTEDVLEDWVSRIPLGRLAKPEEIAEGILFLIRNDYRNGRTIDLDGGLRI